MRKLAIGLLALVTIACLVPLAGLVAASTLADALGCPLDEGSAHPCLLAGHDIGGALYTGQVLGWLMLLTAPVLLVCAVLWLVLAILWFRRPRAPKGRP